MPSKGRMLVLLGGAAYEAVDACTRRREVGYELLPAKSVHLKEIRGRRR
jgi:hypothetical protein